MGPVICRQKPNVNNYIVKSHRSVIVVTESVTMRTNKAKIIFIIKTCKNMKSSEINSIGYQWINGECNVILTIDEVHTAKKKNPKNLLIKC